MAQKKVTKKVPRAKEVEFKVGDHVGARVKGYSIWPAIITNIETKSGNRRKIHVRFFHTDDTGSNFQDLKHFKQISDKELIAGLKKKGFKEALKLCQASMAEHGEAAIKEEKPTQATRSRAKLDETFLVNQQEASSSPAQSELPTSPSQDDGAAADESSLPSSSPTQTQQSLESLEKPPQITAKINPLATSSSSSSSTSSTSPPDTGDRCGTLVLEAAQLNNIKKATKVSTRSDKSIGIATPAQYSSSDLKIRPAEQVKPTKSEEENVGQTTDRETILAKVREKLEAKLQEKEALKKDKKSQRLSEKVSRNFPIIESKLNELEQVFKTLKKCNANQNIVNWKQTVQKFKSFLPVLEKFIKTYFINDYSAGCEERKRCHDKLNAIVSNLNEIKDEKVLPRKYIKDIKSMRGEMKGRRVVKEFICQNLENSKNAMSERNAVDLK